MAFDHQVWKEWKERNLRLKEKRVELKESGLSAFSDHAEAERRAMEESNNLDEAQKIKLKSYLDKLLAIQHLVQKKGTTAEYLDVLDIKIKFINELKILKISKERLNVYWKKYK